MPSKVKIIVGKGENQKSFIVPRAFLEHSSEVFKDKCADGNELILLPDDDPENFDIFCRYLKTGKVELDSLKKTLAFYSLLEKHSITEGKLSCIRYLREMINPSTAGEILQIASELHNDHLSYVCWHFILINADKVLNSATFRNLEEKTVSAIIRQDFINAASDEDKSDKDEKEPSSLEEMMADLSTEGILERIVNKIKRMRSNLDETAIYKALMEWGKEEFNRNKRNGEEKSLREILKPLFRHIRFCRMSKSEISQLLWEDEILTDEEQQQILESKNNATPSYLTTELLNFSSQERQKPENPWFCCEDEANSKHHTIKEVFRAKSHNLYIQGVMLHQGCSPLQECTIEVRNITTQKKFQQEQKAFPLGKGFIVTLDDASFFVAEGEEFEIILQTDRNKALPCCLRKCGTGDLFERLPYSGSNTGHFLGIIAIPVTP